MIDPTMMVTYATCTVPYTHQLSNKDDYAHTHTHAQSTGGKCHRMNEEILPQSHFDQAAVPADARRRRTDRNFRGGHKSAANEQWCADADTTPTATLGSNASIQGDLRRRCHTSLQGVDCWRLRHQWANIATSE